MVRNKHMAQPKIAAVGSYKPEGSELINKSGAMKKVVKTAAKNYINKQKHQDSDMSKPVIDRLDNMKRLKNGLNQ